MPLRRALIVASGAYDDEKLRDLRAPEVDAQRLADVLQNPEIGNFEVDIAVNEAERSLRRRIARFFGSTNRDDELLLYISGHGIKDADGRLYLAAADSELDLLDATALSTAWLDEQIARSPSRRKLLLLDCCFSGRFPFNTTAKGGTSVDVPEQLQGRGRAVITASNAMEYAYEGDTLTGEPQPSYFTSALLEGLETGKADRDQDHQISVDELYDYIFDRVRELTPNQTPTKQSALEGPLYVARSNYTRSVEPAKLDERLILLTQNSVPGARLDAVDELDRLLNSQTPSVVLAAKNLLEAMLDDDSRRVLERVTAVLAAHEPCESDVDALPEAKAHAEREPVADGVPESAAQTPHRLAPPPRREENGDHTLATAKLDPTRARSPGRRAAVLDRMSAHPVRWGSAALLTISVVIVAILIINSLQSGPKPDYFKACVVTDTHSCVFKGPGGLGYQSVPWLTVPSNAVLKWQCSSCTLSGMVITSSGAVEPTLIYSKRAKSGMVALDPGRYHQVTISADGSYTITVHVPG